MRPGQRQIGNWRLGEAETSTRIPVSDYLADYVSALGSGDAPAWAAEILGRPTLPYKRDFSASTAALMPALAGTVPARDLVVLPGTGKYAMFLDGYGILPDWFNATWTQAVNAPDTLEFCYPTTAELAEYLKRPAVVTVYDPFGVAVQSFDLVDILPEVSRGAQGTIVKAHGRGMLGRLADAFVDYYGGVRAEVREMLTQYEAWLTANATASDAAKARALYDLLNRLAAWGTAYTSTDATNTALATYLEGYDTGWFTFTTTDPYFTKDPDADVFYAVISAYCAENDGYKTIADHARDLLVEYQVSPVAVDAITELVSGTRRVTFEMKSLLDCIRELWKLSGEVGQFSVTPDGRFVWLDRLGLNNSVPVTLGMNLRSMERRCDAADMATRLYVYGSGLAQSSRIVAMREGDIATYGVIERHIVVDEIADQGTLNSFATEMIAAIGYPLIEYSVDLVDLYSIGQSEAITIGCSVLITDTDLGISATQNCIGISRNLANPLDVRVTLSHEVRNLPQVVKAILDRIGRLEGRNERERIEKALRSGGLSGVPRTEFDDERTADLRVADSLEYYDGNGWNPLSRFDPYGAPQPGDTRLNDGALEHFDGTEWTDFGGDDIQPVAIENAEGDSHLFAREDHEHAGPVPEPVRALPEIPTAGIKYVFWQSATTAPEDFGDPPLDAGTGDDQVWMAYAGQTEWTPTQNYTDLSGEVVVEPPA